MGCRTRLTALVAATVCATLAAASAAASSGWFTKADAVCTAWHQKAVAAFGANPAQPTTLRGTFEFMLKARRIESGELQALKAITLPRPAAATTALALASADLRELDAGLAAYRDGNRAEFTHDVSVWQADRRASRAFTALGARACA
jgi:hypothetical protein